MILIGLVIVLVLGLFLIYQKQAASAKITSEQEESSELQTMSDPVEQYVQACLKSVTEEGLLTLGLQGGYYDVPSRALPTVYGDVPYYFDRGDISQVPSLDDMRAEMGKYLIDNLPYCLNAFIPLKEQGYTITEGAMQADVTITQWGVSTTLYYPIEVSTVSGKKTFSTFTLDYPVRLQEIYSVMNRIMTTNIADPYNVYYSLILELNQEYGMQIDTLTYGNDVLIYIVQDPKSKIQNVPYVFLFAFRASSENEMPIINTETLEVRYGETVQTYLDVLDRNGDLLFYYTDDPSVKLNAYSGYLEYTATERANHVVEILVDDGYDTVSKNITIQVIS